MIFKENHSYKIKKLILRYIMLNLFDELFLLYGDSSYKRYSKNKKINWKHRANGCFSVMLGNKVKTATNS
jgi:hypothetical protein